MADALKERFYDQVSISEEKGDIRLLLDGRAVKTPLGRQMLFPTVALAEAVATEWQAQEKKIDFETMPLTRLVFSAIDQVGANRAHVLEEVLAYAETDLICYRADAPQELIARQEELWDPLITWAGETLNAPLVTTAGIVAATQPEGSLTELRSVLELADDYALAGLHMATKLSGSLVIALALRADFIDADKAWTASRVDEQWQIDKWGEDQEATALAKVKEADFKAANQYLKLAC